MVSRSLLALFTIGMIAVASVNADSVEEIDVDTYLNEDLGEIERGFWSSALKAAAKKALEFVKEKSQNVNWDCVGEVTKACSHIKIYKHPIDYSNCAIDYVKEHKDHCYHSKKQGEEDNEE